MTINTLYVILDTFFTIAITFCFGSLLSTSSFLKKHTWPQALFLLIGIIICIMSNIIQIIWLGQGKDLKATMFDIYFYAIACVIDLATSCLIIVRSFKCLKKDKTN